MKRIFKKLILSCLDKLGFLYFLHYKNRHKISVLMLHGVMTPHDNTIWNPLRPQLSPGELQRVLGILSSYYQFITVKQCIDMLEGKIPLIDNALLITFDDGYRNNIDYALPICEQFAIKPVLFVTTGYIDSGLPFWFDRLDYALQQNMGGVISFEYQGAKYCFDATSRQALKTSYQAFRDHCKQVFTEDIEMNQLFNALSEMLEIRAGKALREISTDDDWSAMVSWPQLREAVKTGRLDVSSHTVDHLRVDRLPEEQILIQLQQSKMRIEQELAGKCHYFCYPNGNYNDLAISLLKKTGYRAAFSTDVGLCEVKDSLMTLKRFNFPANKTKNEILYQLNR
ncbi:polysaccharide deacetylase [Psychromonas ingrahamii 37]|uniref:Polysaccharide deacetylase n=1 Tax=Psychromonas ingrahamii (strain DSM 17664 / CCUG 51855 / 37) TaxID=357804 RepID=A1SS48_PSYIN|nr:polysaccharide deacetylase family protein [Psychromonas ingrahamii]ABM02313.1 polysaccharide deacetylase [Psychromonas ingrahamii 37]